MSTPQRVYRVAWLALAALVIAALVIAHFAPVIVGAVILAWFGGIVTERLRVDHRDRPAGGEVRPRGEA